MKSALFSLRDLLFTVFHRFSRAQHFDVTTTLNPLIEPFLSFLKPRIRFVSRRSFGPVGHESWH